MLTLHCTSRHADLVQTLHAGVSQRESPVYVKNAHSGTIPAAIMLTHSGNSCSAVQVSMQGPTHDQGMYELSGLGGRGAPKKDTMAKCQK